MRAGVRLRLSGRVAPLAALALLAACSPRPADLPAAVAADSVVLERTPCFGACPTYRLRLAASGAVRFEGRAGRDSSTVATDSIPPSVVAGLVARAERDGFFALPAQVRADPTLCPLPATDHPSVVVSIFRPQGASRVDYDTGCYAGRPEAPEIAAPLVRLRALAAAIDSAGGASRWIRPAPLR